jgi:aminomethyltransferase
VGSALWPGTDLWFGGILLSTPLDRLHRRLGARMVPFAGYEMPLQYEGIIAEHLACRAGAAWFDVSHMGQAEIFDPAAFERLVPGDIAGLKPGRQRYTLLLNEAGGIIDDQMVANLGGHLQLVLNAGRKDFDIAHIAAHGVAVTAKFHRALLALQGPKAAAMLPEATGMSFMAAAEMAIAGIPCVVTRSGYTGEDGFEIGCEPDDAEALANALLGRGAVPAGLGARDSLRLEAGLCLYGNDIDETTNPVAANLAWAISKRRRTNWDFLGAAPVREMLDDGAAEKLVGIRLAGRAPARAGAVIRSAQGETIGRVTSGIFSPSLNGAVALGYVRADHAEAGTELDLIVRDRPLPGVVTNLPFIPHRYAR